MKTIDDPQNARSRRTAESLMVATRSLLEECGLEYLTMAAVAERACVTRRAVYLHFGSLNGLLVALFHYVNKVEDLDKSTQPVWTAPDPVTALTEWARHLARFHPRVMAVARAIERVRATSADAAKHWEIAMRDQRDACTRLIQWLADEDQLAPPWTVDAATDMLWALMSFDMLEALTADRRWSRGRYAEHLALLFRSTFVRAERSD